MQRLLRWLIILGLSALLLGTLTAGVIYWHLARQMPSVARLKDYHLQVPLYVLSADGKLMAHFGEVRRVPVHITHIPALLKEAVMSAEDADFYYHPGVDWRGTLRAAWKVILAGGHKVQGGSTITQQVVRSVFLNARKTYSRKLIEMITALRMEKMFSKNQILELYLNKMFLGHRVYGVAAAAHYYYGKKLDQLTVSECAAIAASFQLPSAVNPLNHPARLLRRRNWVLGEMLAHHYLTPSQYRKAVAAHDDAAPHEQKPQVQAPYLAEMVRQQLIRRFGKAALTEGYVVKTTIDSRCQHEALMAVHKGLISYDHRHGWRGSPAHRDLTATPSTRLLDTILANNPGIAGLLPGIVTRITDQTATVYLGQHEHIQLTLAAMNWAHRYIDNSHTGPTPTCIRDVLKRGDIIRLAQDTQGQWQLAQLPRVQAALVSLNPENGSIQALVGGFSFRLSKFNRATMAIRQTGSSFKPYLYSAALDHGFTPASMINDAPVALFDPTQPDNLWTPSNDNHQFAGPMRLRQALVHSKNLVTIRLLNAIGIGYTRTFATRFGFARTTLPNDLSLALGTASASTMAMARGYAVMANGGYLVTPYFIREIDNSDGIPVYIANPVHACRTCKERLLHPTQPAPPIIDTRSIPVNRAAVMASMTTSTSSPYTGMTNPQGNKNLTTTTPVTTHPLLAPHVLDIRTDYLITSLMKGVILHGTGRAAKALGRADLAGKTGTTNDYRDAWFVGFDGNLSTAVWVGFDDFSSLGHNESGSRVALPIWIDYMGAALKGLPEKSLPRPPGIRTVLINRHTGLPTRANDPDTMTEIFKVENINRLRAQAIRQQKTSQQGAYTIF